MGFRLSTCRSTSTCGGSEWSKDWRPPPLRWFGWFWRTTDQDWSPVYTEQRRALGLRIGRFRLMIERTVDIWRDGKRL